MSAHTEHCTFCDLVQGSAEVSVCHEDADSLAFMDIQPVNTGHVLVVPRAHYNSLIDVPAELGMHLFRVTMRLVGAIRKVTGCDDMNIVVNSGAAAGQDEPHYHVHIIPRRHGDGFQIDLPFGESQMPDRTALDAMAVQLIAAMRDPMKWVRGAPYDPASSEIGDESAARADVDATVVRTIEIPAAETARMRAVATDDPSVGRQGISQVLEREVVVKVAREGISSGDPASRGAWHVEEGAHGELIYDRRDTL